MSSIDCDIIENDFVILYSQYIESEKNIIKLNWKVRNIFYYDISNIEFNEIFICKFEENNIAHEGTNKLEDFRLIFLNHQM